MAGVTIAALTGSDSAPAKANEAKQKNDIGTAKDDVSLIVTNAQMEAYESVYVEGKQAGTNEIVTAENASTNVGAYVRKKVYEKYKASEEFKTGIASIVATEDGQITISTTDFKEIGIIELSGGALSWITPVPITTLGAITPANQKVKQTRSIELTALINSDATESLTWTSSNPSIASVVSIGKNKARVTGETVSEQEVTITASYGDLTPVTTTVTVTEDMPIVGEADADYISEFGNQVFARAIENGEYTNTAEAPYSAGGENVWRLFYKDNDYAYLISDSTVGDYTPSTEYNGKTQYDNGSKVSNVGKGLNYGLIANETFSSNTYDNVKAVAWMTDISADGPWASYKGPDADYAIGSPTIELFVKSYKAVNTTASISYTPLNKTGYSFTGSGFVTTRHNIWAGKGIWWIASPRRDESNALIRVWGNYFENATVNYHNSVRPIVMIQASTFETKYITVDQ